MNTFIEEHRMYRVSKLKVVRANAGMVCAAWMSLALVALLASCATTPEGSPAPSAQPERQAVAESPPPAEQQPAPQETPDADVASPAKAGSTPPAAQPSESAAAKPDKSDASQAISVARAAQAQDKAAAKAEQAKKPPEKETGSGCGGTSGPDPTPSSEGPQPRWVCKEQTVNAEPIWRGKSIDFAFTISNEGEADLKIKLKGG